MSRPLLHPFGLRFVGASRATRAQLRLSLVVPSTAARLDVVLVTRSGRTLMRRRVAVTPGARRVVRVALSASEARRVKPGLHLVMAALRAPDGTAGNLATHWVRVRHR
jgi:hypothetical protein